MSDMEALSINLHYGGLIEYKDNQFSYKGGDVKSGLVIDPDYMTWSLFEGLCVENGSKGAVDEVWYKLPEEEMNSIRLISEDRDEGIRRMCGLAMTVGEVDLYIDQVSASVTGRVAQERVERMEGEEEERVDAGNKTVGDDLEEEVVEGLEEEERADVEGSSSGTVLPKFVKVYLPGESGDDLELPTSYNSSLPKSLPRTVTVTSIYGKNWTMVLRKCDGDDVERFVLVNGWKRIAEDEGLKERDFLAFEFDGSRCFNFCVFDGNTMCKRLVNSLIEVKSESDGNDGVVDSSDKNSDEVESEDDADDDDHKNYLDDPTNASFTMILNQKKKSQLRIPNWVIYDYNLKFSESVTIVDPLALKFGPLERGIRIEERNGVFVKKFGSVIRRNQIKVTDTMLFELKKTDNNLVHTIKVYII